MSSTSRSLTRVALATLVGCGGLASGGGDSGPDEGHNQDSGPPDVSFRDGHSVDAKSTDAHRGSDDGAGDATACTDPAPCGVACPYTDAVDHDGDGWSYVTGDCNDCDPLINPGAYDIPKDGIDEDCNGVADDEPTGCDSASTVTLASTDPNDGARAIDICRYTTSAATGKARTWGVVASAYVLPDGTTSTSTNFALGHGLLSAFGVNNAEQGVAMLGLSSGTARQPTDPGYKNVSGFDKGYTSGAPAGYPKSVPACPGVAFGLPHDGVALSLTIRVPTNARTLSFEENFFTFEFPEYICSPYNDTYVVMMSPKVDPSLPDDNIAFDSMGNPISVNLDNALLQVCTPQTAGGRVFTCTLGAASLTGTGFEQTTDSGPHAATGWLTTTAPVDSLRGQEITLLFAIWDSTDGVLDSTVLIDNLTWGFAATGGVTTAP